MASRTLKLLHPASREDIDQLTSRRALPTAELEHLDPFLFFHHHGPHTFPARNKGLPFATQPQRGFETVIFVLSGSLAHKDSSSGDGETVVDGGGVQWLTAGRGLVHSELSPRKFLEKGGEVEMLELWVNLPSRWKMTTPRYQALQRKDLPSFLVGGDNVGVDVTPVSGEWCNEFGPFEPITDVALATLMLGGRSGLLDDTDGLGPGLAESGVVVAAHLLGLFLCGCGGLTVCLDLRIPLGADAHQRGQAHVAHEDPQREEADGTPEHLVQSGNDRVGRRLSSLLCGLNGQHSIHWTFLHSPLSRAVVRRTVGIRRTSGG
jgi:hypothetical protein